MRRHIKRRVIYMEPSPLLTNRGNPQSWHIKYDCGHEDLFRCHYGHFYALQGVFKKGYEVKMCCSKCG